MSYLIVIFFLNEVVRANPKTQDIYLDLLSNNLSFALFDPTKSWRNLDEWIIPFIFASVANTYNVFTYLNQITKSFTVLFLPFLPNVVVKEFFPGRLSVMNCLSWLRANRSKAYYKISFFISHYNLRITVLIYHFTQTN
jgi:hypothetical protein